MTKHMVAGVGRGMLFSVFPIYLAEAAPFAGRDSLVSARGVTITFDFGLANWVAKAGASASSHAQSR